MRSVRLHTACAILLVGLVIGAVGLATSAGAQYRPASAMASVLTLDLEMGTRLVRGYTTGGVEDMRGFIGLCDTATREVSAIAVFPETVAPVGSSASVAVGGQYATVPPLAMGNYTGGERFDAATQDPLNAWSAVRIAFTNGAEVRVGGKTVAVNGLTATVNETVQNELATCAGYPLPFPPEND